jgi:hypothetical protein
MGALTDIDQEGFAAAAFHSFPDMLKPDPISGDYGPNFFGHAWNTATYIVRHPQFGWVAFGGNIKVNGRTISATLLDSARSRVYIASLGLWLTLDSGAFETIKINSATGAVEVGLSAATPFTPSARLHIEQPAKVHGVGTYHPTKTFNIEREAYVIPLDKEVTRIELSASH